MLGKEEIENRFGFHKATIEGSNATLPKHRDVRILFREFAEKLDEVLPEGRTKALFWTHLETASMWSHKAIAELAPVVEEPAELTPQQVQLSNLFGTGRVGGPAEGKPGNPDCPNKTTYHVTHLYCPNPACDFEAA